MNKSDYNVRSEYDLNRNNFSGRFNGVNAFSNFDCHGSLKNPGNDFLNGFNGHDSSNSLMGAILKAVLIGEFSMMMTEWVVIFIDTGTRETKRISRILCVINIVLNFFVKDNSV